jgi:hypothetical protein
MGLDNPVGRWELFWSGIASDLTQFSIPVAVVAFWYHHTCHVNHPRFCWRPGTHPVAGTSYRACKKHHPAVPDRISADHIAHAHRQVTDSTGGAS